MYQSLTKTKPSLTGTKFQSVTLSLTSLQDEATRQGSAAAEYAGLYTTDISVPGISVLSARLEGITAFSYFTLCFFFLSCKTRDPLLPHYSVDVLTNRHRIFRAADNSACVSTSSVHRPTVPSSTFNLHGFI